jgi:cytochrome oxidase Cu insertion factor (SCO1/SenC/PrrC family)
MNSNFKKRLTRTGLMSVVAVLIGAGIGWMQVKNESAVVQKNTTAQNVPGIKVGGPFELVDQSGATVTEKNYTGKYKLIYFGFTYCPAICPTELQKITAAMNTLEPALAENIQPLFISIDPERDTVSVMREYVKLFHPRLQGLTGSRAQIDKVLADYRVFAKKVQEPGMSDYTMDHSSFIYLMDKDDNLLSIYRIQDDDAFVAADIREKLASS